MKYEKNSGKRRSTEKWTAKVEGTADNLEMTMIHRPGGMSRCVIWRVGRYDERRSTICASFTQRGKGSALPETRETFRHRALVTLGRELANSEARAARERTHA